MMDDVGARFARIESDHASLAVRVSGLEREMSGLLPMVAEFATLSERVKNFGDDLSEIKASIQRRDDEAMMERKETARDRRAAVRWAIALTVTIILGLLAVAATVVASGGHL